MEIPQTDIEVQSLIDSPQFEGIDALLTNSPDFIMNIDADSRITYVNRNLPDFSQNEVIGKSFEFFTDKEYSDVFNKRIKNSFKTGRPDSVILNGRGEKNPFAWYEVRFGPVFRDDKVISVMLIVTDITRRKKAEEALEKSEIRYRLLAENMSDFVWIVDHDLVFNFVSPSVKNLLGYESTEIANIPWLNILTDQAKDVLEKELGKLSEINDHDYKFSSISLELEFVTKSGKNIWTETKLSLLRNDMNYPEGILGISRDITERKIADKKLKELNQKLAKSNNDLEQFAYVASHDLQEPLRMVSQFLTLLYDRYKGKLGGDADSFINFAVDGAKRMQAMIEDLLDFSRLSTRKRDYITVDLNNVFKNVKTNLMFSIDESNAEIQVEKLPVVQGDAIQLGLLFQNIISNAIKFCDKEKPMINISVAEMEESYEFCFKDNGPGFNMKYSDKIFNIFERIGKDTLVKGTGMGLAICKKIVERHHGTIRAESQTSQGSKFIFELPKRKNVI